MPTNDDFAQLEAAITGLECEYCETQPRVAYLKGTANLRCNCWPLSPALRKEIHGVEYRRQQMEEAREHRADDNDSEREHWLQGEL